MSTRERPTEAGTRERLLDAAIGLLATDGIDAVQARRVAAEIGTSTMTVYTNFGGMPQLTEAIVREGFRRLGALLDTVAETDDPVADLFALGLAYREHALDNPPLYRLMFGLAAPVAKSGARKDLLSSGGSPSDLAEGQHAFEYLVKALDRVVGSGRIRAGEDPIRAAAQVWSAIHGYVLLEVAGFFGADDGVEQVLIPLAINLAVGVGDTAERAAASAEVALTRQRTRPGAS